MKSNPAITVERMWPNGPLRRFTLLKNANIGFGIRYGSKYHDGYVGSYVCENCKNECAGVYHVDNKWLGGCCRGF